jgi:hypothetical protein
MVKQNKERKNGKETKKKRDNDDNGWVMCVRVRFLKLS